MPRDGLPTPAWSDDESGFDPEAPVIVKPVWEHGSLGIDDSSVVHGCRCAARAIKERNAALSKTEHFAEAYIEGREFNLALMERRRRAPSVLPIAEILFEGFGLTAPRASSGYDAKWTPESAAYIGTPRRFGLERKSPSLPPN